MSAYKDMMKALFEEEGIISELKKKNKNTASPGEKVFRTWKQTKALAAYGASPIHDLAQTYNGQADIHREFKKFGAASDKYKEDNDGVRIMHGERTSTLPPNAIPAQLQPLLAIPQPYAPPHPLLICRLPQGHHARVLQPRTPGGHAHDTQGGCRRLDAPQVNARLASLQPPPLP